MLTKVHDVAIQTEIMREFHIFVQSKVDKTKLYINDGPTTVTVVFDSFKLGFWMNYNNEIARPINIGFYTNHDCEWLKCNDPISLELILYMKYLHDVKY